jgi:hypothetical protein
MKGILMTAALKASPQNQFQNCFEGWTRLWHRWIASQREYFEGDHSDIQRRYVALLPRWVRALYCQTTYFLEQEWSIIHNRHITPQFMFYCKKKKTLHRLKVFWVVTPAWFRIANVSEISSFWFMISSLRLLNRRWPKSQLTHWQDVQ